MGSVSCMLIRLYEVLVKYILFVFMFLLSACVVMPQEYFQPKAQGAIVERESCRGKVGVDNQLVYELESVKVELVVWEHKGKGATYLGIAFKIFDDGNVIWPEQVVHGYVDGAPISFEIKEFSRLRVVDGELLTKDYPLNTLMAKEGGDEYETYHESVLLSNELVSEVKISKIRLVINGKEHVLSDLTFTKKTGVFLHPLNC